MMSSMMAAAKICPPSRPASGDMIYVMYAYVKVTITVCPCWPASTTNESGLVTLTDRQTSDRRQTKAALNAPAYNGRGIIIVLGNR